jgi:hypothetical protein
MLAPVVAPTMDALAGFRTMLHLGVEPAAAPATVSLMLGAGKIPQAAASLGT